MSDDRGDRPVSREEGLACLAHHDDADLLDALAAS
jgi:hypothetical protein